MIEKRPAGETAVAVTFRVPTDASPPVVAAAEASGATTAVDNTSGVLPDSTGVRALRPSSVSTNAVLLPSVWSSRAGAIGPARAHRALPPKKTVARHGSLLLQSCDSSGVSGSFHSSPDPVGAEGGSVPRCSSMRRSAASIFSSPSLDSALPLWM